MSTGVQGGDEARAGGGRAGGATVGVREQEEQPAGETTARPGVQDAVQDKLAAAWWRAVQRRLAAMGQAVQQGDQLGWLEHLAAFILGDDVVERNDGIVRETVQVRGGGWQGSVQLFGQEVVGEICNLPEEAARSALEFAYTYYMNVFSRASEAELGAERLCSAAVQ